MCYDVKFLTRKMLHYAKRRGEALGEIQRIKFDLEILTKGIEPQFCISGFSHPHILVFTNKYPLKPALYSWGLVPAWVKDEKQAGQIQNKTINAQVETIFEKPSFRKPAMHQRCLIMVDGFYEHYYFHQKAFPIHIINKSASPMVIAGLWDVWKMGDRNPHYSVSMVTTKANGLLRLIHNSPKIREPRMPLILNRESEKVWLNDFAHRDDVMNVICSEMKISLNAYPVAPIHGKKSLGNTEEAAMPYRYAEFKNQPFTEFIKTNIK